MNDLPGPVAAAIDAANANDTAAFLACFIPDGVVDDWGREFRGPDEIRVWSDREFIGAHVSLDVKEVEFRRNGAGRMLMARIYQPKGPGPFPTVLDLHGGAWNRKDRHAEEPMDRALAASGLLVVAVDMTVAPEAPYPACVQDANYAVRWLKANAATWNGDAAKLGIYGSSSGGHVAELLALRPRDARYNAIPLATAPNVDASGDGAIRLTLPLRRSYGLVRLFPLPRGFLLRRSARRLLRGHLADRCLLLSSHRHETTPFTV